MANDAIELIRLRNNFYRDNYRRLVISTLICLLIIIILSGLIFYMITHQATPKYYASAADGRIIELVPLNRPNQSNQTILDWSTEAAVAAYTLDFVNYQQQLQNASNYFTSNGWKQFQAELVKSKNLDAIKQEHLISHAVATGTAVIVDQFWMNDQYTWRVQMPMLVSLESPGRRIPQALLVTLLVTRVSTLDNPKGIAITSFAAQTRIGAT